MDIDIDIVIEGDVAIMLAVPERGPPEIETDPVPERVGEYEKIAPELDEGTT